MTKKYINSRSINKTIINVGLNRYFESKKTPKLGLNVFISKNRNFISVLKSKIHVFT